MEKATSHVNSTWMVDMTVVPRYCFFLFLTAASGALRTLTFCIKIRDCMGPNLFWYWRITKQKQPLESCSWEHLGRLNCAVMSTANCWYKQNLLTTNAKLTKHRTLQSWSKATHRVPSWKQTRIPCLSLHSLGVLSFTLYCHIPCIFSLQNYGASSQAAAEMVSLFLNLAANNWIPHDYSVQG